MRHALQASTKQEKWRHESQESSVSSVQQVTSLLLIVPGGPLHVARSLLLGRLPVPGGLLVLYCSLL